MPVTDKSTSLEPLYQRVQYAKGGVGRAYWDYRDGEILSLLDFQDRDIVDLGCGEGLTVEKLLATFPQSNILGIEALDENVQICLNHCLPVRKGDARDIDLPDGSVDAVLLIEVVEHLDSPEQVISEIHRILRPGGKLLIVFPNDLVFKLARILTLRIKEAFYDPGHVRQWTPSDIRQFVEQMGFEVCYVKPIPFLLWPLSLHCVVRARKLL